VRWKVPFRFREYVLDSVQAQCPEALVILAQG